MSTSDEAGASPQHPGTSSTPAPAGPERRHITVMFCDLVGSTALSQALDPEELSDVLRAYQSLAGEVMERNGGSITRYMGDGILVLFGYPVVHEDSTTRAVHAALEMVERVQQLDRAARFGAQVSVQVRIGLATGLTVVGEIIGTGFAREESVVGETPNLAARLQGLAGPDEVVIAQATYALVAPQFECRDAGEHSLKGFDQPVRAWRVLAERDPLAVSDAGDARDEGPMVDRHDERDVLDALWQACIGGRGGVVSLAGEAGIGKSRLVRDLRSRVKAADGAWLRLQCLPYFSDSALHPVATRLARIAGLIREDDAATRRSKLDAAFDALRTQAQGPGYALLAELLDVPLPPDEAALEHSAERRKQLLLEMLARLLVTLGAPRPMVLVLEDAHWMDPTTGELLGRLASSASRHRVLILVTLRDDATLPDGLHVDRSLSLQRLQGADSISLVEAVAAGNGLSRSMVSDIVRRTDGVPLFVEELTRTALAHGGSLAEEAVPSSLQDSLMARIDGLGADKPVAQVAAVLGQQFPRGLMQAVTQLDDAQFDAVIDRLIAASVLIVRGDDGDELAFRHALVRDAAYESLLRRRRESLHGLAADALEARFSDVVERSPELVAQHLSAARRLPEAVRRFIDAGRRAGERSANTEAVSHLRRAQEALSQLPQTPERDALELELLTLLGAALIVTEGGGVGSVAEAYEQALAVGERLPESALHFQAHWGWWRVSMNFDVGQNRADRLLVLARRLDDAALVMQAHHCQWASLFHLGQHGQCLQHVREGLALYDGDVHAQDASTYGGHDARVCGEGEQALALWLGGRFDEARAALARALGWARELRHVGSIAHAMDYAMILELYAGDGEAAHERASELEHFAMQQGLPDYVARARFFEGWARAARGAPREGLKGMQAAVTELSRIGTREDFPMFYELMVQVMARHGQQQPALKLLLASFRESKNTGMRFWLPEQHRARGELMRLAGARDKAMEALRQSLEVATHQGARLFALRAARDLAAVLAAGGDEAAAVAILRPQLAGLEAQTSPELIAARAQLQALAPS